MLKRDKGVFGATVDYDVPLRQLIEMGSFSRANPLITAENFPAPFGEKDMKRLLLDTFSLAQPIGSDEIIRQMLDAHFRPATIRELLFVHQLKPDFWGAGPLVALGSRCFDLQKVEHVVGVSKDKSNILLDLAPYGRHWHDGNSFLGVYVSDQAKRKSDAPF